MSPLPSNSCEWLETDGLGGFASGTVSGVRTRRYHALLLAGENGPVDRRVLVHGFDAMVTTPAGEYAISSQRYCPDVIAPDGVEHIHTFHAEPWPTWIYALADGTLVAQGIFVPHGLPAVVVTWKLVSERASATLRVRPFLSGRGYHELHHENDAFQFAAEVGDGSVSWTPYAGGPTIHALANGAYAAEPHWYRGFRYLAETYRGVDDNEDLAAPGVFTFDLARGEAVMIFAHPAAAVRLAGQGLRAVELAQSLRRIESHRRKMFATPLHRAADHFVVRRGAAPTIIAGYPWFTDWGRDTFIALRGLCLAGDRLDDARGILLAWAGTLSDGMVPNRFPDHGATPEFNSVDASLWFVVAVHEFLATADQRDLVVDPGERTALHQAITSIVEGYTRGTRHGIKLDDDGLLACGEPGVQLTWMDARVGDWVVTPRIGKPVEVQALWINALWIASERMPKHWRALFEQARAAFATRFWNEATGCLFDVIDVDHQAGRVDPSIRPNQVYAVGGLPLALLKGETARRVVGTVEQHLLTPLGLRSLAPGDRAYRARYAGGVWERDGAYHQGTVWPFLMGAFVEAWLRVAGGPTEVKRAEARTRFVAPLLAQFEEAGLGQVPEIADGDAPHRPRGCPWQAWSLGELLRLEHQILAPRTAREVAAVARSSASRSSVAMV